MSPPKKHPVRGLIVNAALILTAFGLLALAIYQNRAPLRDVLSNRIDFRLFGLAVAIYLSTLVLTFLRWFALVRVIEPRFRVRDALLLGFIGNVFNLVIPGAVGGDFIKAAFLVRMDINRTQAVASMVIDRILGLLGLFLLASVAGAFAWPMAPPRVRVLIALAWAAVATGLMVLGSIFNQSLTKRFPKLLEGDGRAAKILRELRVMSITYRGRLDLIAGLLLGSAGLHALFVCAFYLASLAIFPMKLPGLAQHFLMVPLIQFTTVVPLPFGALGLTEQVSSVLFRLVNHPVGAVAMMAFRVLTYIGGFVSALVYLTRVKQVRALTETADRLQHELLDAGPDGPPVPTNDPPR